MCGLDLVAWDVQYPTLTITDQVCEVCPITSGAIVLREAIRHPLLLIHELRGVAQSNNVQQLVLRGVPMISTGTAWDAA